MNETTSTPVNPQDLNRAMEQANLQRRVKAGGRTFYWIAGLSVLNSLVAIFGGGIYFVVGLGVTLFIDGFASAFANEFGGSTLILVLGFLFSLMFDLIFVVLGYFAARGRRWAFITGMTFYGLDALLMLVFQEWLGLAFHLFFLWDAFRGFQALKKLQTLIPQVGGDTAFPQDIGTA